MASRPLGVVLASALLGVLLSGCPGQQTLNSVSQHLTLVPQSGGGFVGYTDTSFGEAVPSGKTVHLLSATLASSSGEFSWITSMVGTAGAAAGPVLLQKSSFEGATSPTELDVVATGDLLPYFPDRQNFRVDWTLQYAQQQTQSYPDGITLTFTYQLQIE